jgi:hypothetical protein
MTRGARMIDGRQYLMHGRHTATDARILAQADARRIRASWKINGLGRALVRVVRMGPYDYALFVHGSES